MEISRRLFFFGSQRSHSARSGGGGGGGETRWPITKSAPAEADCLFVTEMEKSATDLQPLESLWSALNKAIPYRNGIEIFAFFASVVIGAYVTASTQEFALNDFGHRADRSRSL